MRAIISIFILIDGQRILHSLSEVFHNKAICRRLFLFVDLQNRLLLCPVILWGLGLARDLSANLLNIVIVYDHNLFRFTNGRRPDVTTNLYLSADETMTLLEGLFGVLVQLGRFLQGVRIQMIESEVYKIIAPALSLHVFLLLLLLILSQGTHEDRFLFVAGL